MHWLQLGSNGRSSLQELQLDIVGFLAILGEGSVLANAQVLTLSKWIFLPRLVPAPQALMRPTRPMKLEPVPGHVCGIFSGNYRDSINHIGNIICDASNLPEHSVRVVEIIRKDDTPLKSRTRGPLTVVNFLGFFLTCLLLGLSIWLSDGMSIIATILLSLLSSLIGLGNKWKLQLPVRKKKGTVPEGDVVIRYPKGSFLIVRCSEEVARELYFAPESIHYMLTHGTVYRLISLVGTMMLMGGVICLANAQIELQIAWAGSYMLLGSGYWVVAALPNKMHWDCSCYKVISECLADSKTKKKGCPSENETFTQALWKAIVVTKNIDWVTKSNACPDTRAWRSWLNKAQEVAKFAREPCTYQELTLEGRLRKVKTWTVPVWDPQKKLGELLQEQRLQDEQHMTRGVADV